MVRPLAPIDGWYAGRGWRPFAYQRRAWSACLRGESGLIHAPTGFGKTLAAWLGPVARWMRDHPHLNGAPEAADGPRRPPRVRCAPLSVLWITPLRALANDTVRALLEPVVELGLPWSVELRTSDVSSFRRQQQRRQLPTALVTTPESLSLLLSYPEAEQSFRTLAAVVVDEWHELMGSKRGVQTELALARLRGWRPELTTWGLSATLGNVEQAARVLVGQHARAPRIIAGPRQKRIELVTVYPPDVQRFPWAGHLGQQLVEPLADAIAAARSTLLFTNTRSQAELWYRALLRARPDWLGQVGLHHGSLEREIRQRVERMLAAGELRCVVCTSSMDLGVDFAPVDQVVQLGSPKGIARLMQRAGRSGHQPGATSRILCVPTHSFELAEFAAARDGVRDRLVEPRAPLERPLDVLVQHLVTIAAGGGFEPDRLRAEVRSTWAFRALRDEEWGWALDFVRRGGSALQAYPNFARVVEADGRCRTRSREIEQLHRMNIGTIGIESAMHVRMQRGGRLGSIEESFIARLRPGDVFTFAGRSLELKRVRDMTAWVTPARNARGVVPRWNGGRFSLSTHLGQTMRRQLDEVRRGSWARQELRALRPLLELQDAWSRIPALDELLIERTRTSEGEHWFVYPFEGRLVHEGLAALLAWRIARRTPTTVTLAANDYGFELLATSPDAIDGDGWARLFEPGDLLDDLLACANATQMARRQFRDIARVAGLIIPGFPGRQKSTRQLQASSELFFDVFRDYDPDNLLLRQAHREVLEQQLEVRRLADALDRIAASRIVVVAPPRLSPLAFPLWAERLRAQHVTSEKWGDRVRRMAEQLEHAAGATPRPRPAVRTHRHPRVTA